MEIDVAVVVVVAGSAPHAPAGGAETGLDFPESPRRSTPFSRVRFIVEQPVAGPFWSAGQARPVDDEQVEETVPVVVGEGRGGRHRLEDVILIPAARDVDELEAASGAGVGEAEGGRSGRCGGWGGLRPLAGVALRGNRPAAFRLRQSGFFPGILKRSPQSGRWAFRLRSAGDQQGEQEELRWHSDPPKGFRPAFPRVRENMAT